MDDLITLISQTFEQNDIGVQIATETTTQVWARLQSATRAEFYSAGQNGLQPSLVAVTPIANYAGQKLAEWRGTRYSIYRTYFATGSDEIQLMLQACLKARQRTTRPALQLPAPVRMMLILLTQPLLLRKSLMAKPPMWTALK